MKVYIVTSGEYDDYRIECVFSSENMAEEYIKTRERKNDVPYDEHLHISEFIIDEEKINEENKIIG